jgi:hypothetical protein
MGEQGWDPEVKKFFQKIISTISYGILWLMSTVTAGIYFQLGWTGQRPLYAVVLFYIIAVVAFILLLRYYYRLWNK